MRLLGWLRRRTRMVDGHRFRLADSYCLTHESFDCFSNLRTSQQDALISRP